MSIFSYKQKTNNILTASFFLSSNNKNDHALEYMLHYRSLHGCLIPTTVTRFKVYFKVCNFISLQTQHIQHSYGASVWEMLK